MRIVLGALLCLLAFGAPRAHALPAPMSDQELSDKSDLVALIKVVSVRCSKLTKDPSTGQELPGWEAKAKVLQVKKGAVTPGAFITVAFHAIPQGLLGPWSVYYYPGEEAWTHLTVLSNGATYETTWWNAKSEDQHPPDTKDLPTVKGATVYAKQN